MRFLYTYITALVLLSLTMIGCQKDDNFVIKEEAFSVITSGYNGSSSELEILIDTMTLKYPIEASASFKRTDKYTFGDRQDSVKLVIKEKETGKQVYEATIKKGEYSTTIELIYVNGKLIEKPVMPDNNPAGFRLLSYLFLPRVSGYAEDIDIVYFKLYQVVANGQLVNESEEVLAKVTVKPWTFSPLLQAPVFPGGRTEINGKVYFINPEVRIFKAGTGIPYYQDAGVTLRQNARLPLPLSAKPEITGISERGVPGSMYVENFEKITF